jgi:hypothetical protein
MRVSIELAFSGCMAEARSILRDAVEFVAHGYAMLEDTELQKVWLSKNDEAKAFEVAFQHHKRVGVFKGLEELHDAWRQLSETGAHANLNAMCDRFTIVRSGDYVEWNLHYTGLDERLWATSLFSMLLTCFKMEEALFLSYKSRLQFDVELLRRRGEFERYKETLRKVLITRYKVAPPSPQPA